MIPKERALVAAEIFAAAIFVVASLPALAQPPEPGLKATLEGRYAALRVAMDARDAKALGGLLAPGFVSETVDGKTSTQDEMIRDLAASPKDPNKVSSTMLVEIQKEGTTATVKQEYRVATTRPGANGSAPQKVDFQAISTDTWIEADGVWLLKSTVTQSLDITLDGKHIGHKEHAPPK